jgi:hypothetical protein
MAVMLNLPAETERILKDKAEKAGLTLQRYLQGLAEREATLPSGTVPSPSSLSAEEWSAAWRAWANSDRQLPSGLAIDDSRESIYAGRGE